MNLTNEEKKQYNRHLILNGIGEKGQLNLKKAKVLVIGAGGLGCPVLLYLTAAGVGTIGIIDNDVVDFLSNGFKLRASSGSWNANGSTFIYMAFAENPFVTSTSNGSIPATAR